LEDRCLPSSGTPIQFPMPTVASIGAVLYNGVSGQFDKTITITNNSPTQTIYPFLEGQDTRWDLPKYAGTGAFDPYDPSTQEYRGYIGYASAGKNNAGLPPNSSITITVPLVFWDSGRLNFSTDGADQFQTRGGAPPNAPGAPFYYLDNNTQAGFFGSIDGTNPTKLTFTPIYNSFLNGVPTVTTWKSPVASGLFKNGQTYLVTGNGLPDGETITIDSSHPDYVVLPTPGPSKGVQQYFFTITSNPLISPTTRFIQNGFTLTTGSSATKNGLVMWYHALLPQAPNNDAPFQLTEVTFRGTFYDNNINKGTGFQYFFDSKVFDGIKVDSADYDISFVDTINMPVAMEASNVSIPNTNSQAPFGWVGSGQSLEDFQKALAAFTSTNTGGSNANFVGTYFGGKGFPSYLIMDPSNPDLKLPAGQNLYLATAAGAKGVADIKYYMTFSDGSAINQPRYALTSGGNGPSQLVIGGDPAHPSTGQFLGLNTSTMANQFALKNLIAPNIARGFAYVVTYNGNQLAGNVLGMYLDNKQNIIGVKLDRSVPADAGKQVYTFKLSLKDYAAGGIAGLWYSWAKYYVDHVTSTPPPGALMGTITGNILRLNKPASGLVPGMTVTATGLPTGCVILDISSDQQTIKLSEVATGSPTSFNFAKPAFNSIVGFDPVNTPLVNLDFTKATAAQQAYALSFASTVYVVMSAWSVSVKPGTSNGWDALLVNVIGGNLGKNYLPYANTDVVVTLTNMSKSVLRGVPDYTSPLYSDPSKWYPDPALPEGGVTGLTYNVYNLNPFVWFIHNKLGLTAYAFALDDDVGNVEGGGANHIDISVGGLNGLKNKDPYSPLSQWGVVTTQVPTAQVRSSVIGGMTTPKIVYQIAQFDYPHNTAGTLVNGPGMQMGATVQFTQINNNLAASKIILSNPLMSSSTNSTYSFFGSLVFTGTVLAPGQSGNTIILDSTDAYGTLQKLGPLQNIQVTGEGIAANKTVTIKLLSKDSITGVVTIQLSNSLDPTLVSQLGGFYAYTFGSPVIPLIRDPGFEWANVQGLTGNYNHGAQLSQNTKDWTFTDTTGFAGIAANGSVFGNPPAPQGVQVGFIQKNSSMSQTVTLAKGTYILTLDAAQRMGQQNAQSLNVMVDGMSVGIIKPTGTSFEKLSITFTVSAGKHTIKFVGTQTSDSTVFIDEVACSLQLPRSSPPPPSRSFVAAADSGSMVNVYDSATGTLRFSFLAFDPSFTGGVNVAVGDINGDGVPDIIVAAGAGMASEIKVIDGTKLSVVDSHGVIDNAALLANFDAYDPHFLGGVYVAFGLNGNLPEIITGAGASGGPHVKVIDASKLNQLQANGEIADSALVAQFYAYSPLFDGGVRVAAADLNGDGVLDIITAAGPGGGPEVKAIDGTKLHDLDNSSVPVASALLGQFYAYDSAFNGGVFVATSMIDAHPVIVTGAGAGSMGPQVKVIDATLLDMLDNNSEPTGEALRGAFFAYDPSFPGGVSVAAFDFTGDGVADIATGPGPGSTQPLKVVDGTKLNDLQPNMEIADSGLLDSVFAFGTSFANGIFVGGS
jgi:hypothetical protein